jgi:peptide-methionine (S)-S-oxide reductase
MGIQEKNMHTEPIDVALPDSPENPAALITLAGGCFWCLEAAYRTIPGVVHCESGYSNGHEPEPDYDSVCGGASGHAEVVQVGFDPNQIDLASLLRIFFALHDPTTLNRQGDDIGSQYRSGIYFETPAQEKVIRQVLAEQAKSFSWPIVTEVAPLSNYWPAEAYHQRYYERHPDQGYCAVVIRPKLDKLRAALPQLLV